MSDPVYTPSTEEVRERWLCFDGGPERQDAAEFDIWIASHDRVVAAKALEDAADAVRVSEWWHEDVINEYRNASDSVRAWLRSRAAVLRVQGGQ